MRLILIERSDMTIINEPTYRTLVQNGVKGETYQTLPTRTNQRINGNVCMYYLCITGCHVHARTGNTFEYVKYRSQGWKERTAQRNDVR